MSVLDDTLEERVKRLRAHAARLRSMGNVFKHSTSDLLELADELERRAEALEHPISEMALRLAG